MKIPKRIIQTAKNRSLPLVAAAAAKNMRLLHPDWEYCLFDDNDVRQFIKKEFPEHEATFDGFPYPIQRFDFFRYLAVYRLGGFYFDLDVFLAHRLDPLLDSESVFPFEELTMNEFLREKHHLDWQLGNYAFGAAPGDPFLGAVIKNCVRALKEPAWAAEMMFRIPAWMQMQYRIPMATGPGVLSRTFAENTELQSKVTILFPHDVRDLKAWHQFGDFGPHMMQGSWRPPYGVLRTRIMRFWETRKCRQLFEISGASGPARPGPWRSKFPENPTLVPTDLKI